MEKAYDDRIDRISKIPALSGAKLVNPIRNEAPILDPNAVGARDMLEAIQYSNKNRLIEKFNRDIQALADANPDYSDIINPGRSVEDDAHKIAMEAEKKAVSTSERYRDGSISGTAASLAGSFVAGAKDPVNVATMLLGPTKAAGVGAKALAWMAVKNGAVNAGVEAGMQPSIAKWRKEAGLQYTASNFALNVGSAFALGAAFDISVRAPYRGYKKARGMVPKLDDKGGVIGWHSADDAMQEAATKAKSAKIKKAADGDINAIRELAEETGVINDPVVRGALDSAENENISFGRVDLDDGARLERIAQALRHASDPEDNPPPAPSSPAPKADLKPLEELKPEIEKSLKGVPLDEAIERAVANRLPADDPKAWSDELKALTDSGEDVQALKNLNDPTLQLKLREYASRSVIETSTDLMEVSRTMRAHPEYANNAGRTDFATTARALSTLSDEAFAMVEAGQIKPDYARMITEMQPDAAKHKSAIDHVRKSEPQNADEARVAISETIDKSIGAYHQTILGGRGEPDNLKGGIDDLSSPEVKEQIDSLEALNERLDSEAGQPLFQRNATTKQSAKDLTHTISPDRAIAFNSKWGDLILNKKDRELALSRLEEIAKMDVKAASWDDIVRAKKDIDEIMVAHLQWKDTVDIKQIEDMEISEVQDYAHLHYFDDNLRGGRSMLSPSAKRGPLTEESAIIAKSAVDNIIKSRRKGVRDLLLFNKNIDPGMKSKSKVKDIGGKMKSGFFFKIGRNLAKVPDDLFSQGGQTVINHLTQSGVSRSELDHFKVMELFGNNTPTSRVEFEDAIRQRMFDMKRHLGRFDAENPAGDYSYGNTRALDGPRIPGRGIYFERTLAFPKKLNNKEPYAPGEFNSPHWGYLHGAGVWASIRGSIREDPKYGRMLIGEEIQSDYMQGANIRDSDGLSRRARVSDSEYKHIQSTHDDYTDAITDVMRELRALHTVIPSARTARLQLEVVADRGKLFQKLRTKTGSDQKLSKVVSNLEKIYNEKEHLLTKEVRFKHEAEITVETALDETYVKTMVRDLLFAAVKERANSVAISTSETTARIQASADAAHFYDGQLKNILEKELRRLTGDGDIKLKTHALAKPERGKRQKSFTVWVAKIDNNLKRKIMDEGQPLFQKQSGTTSTKALASTLQTVADRILPDNVKVEVKKRIEAAGGDLRGVTGSYNPLKKLIQVATDNNPDAIQTFGHESVHAFRDLGLITDKEWSTLADAANKSNWANNPTVRKSMEAYADRGYDEARTKELVLEEAIAEQFGDYLTKNIEPSAEMKPIFERIKQFIERLRNALKGQGFQSAEDVFREMNVGEMKGRTPDSISRMSDPLLQQAARKITQTPAFKKWFGDSKVVDEAGEPLVVYHGTRNGFGEFSNAKMGSATGAESAKVGHFFVSDPEVARGYAHYASTVTPIQKLVKKANDAEKRGDWDGYDQYLKQAEDYESQLYKDIDYNGQVIIPTYLSIRKPVQIDAKGMPYTDIEDSITMQINAAKMSGADGVIIKNLDDAPQRNNMIADHYVAFDPTQIKSIHNQGTFDPADPRILYQMLEEQSDFKASVSTSERIGGMTSLIEACK
jgi:hypothetical protein